MCTVAVSNRSRIRLLALIIAALVLAGACYVPFMANDLGDVSGTSQPDGGGTDPGDPEDPTDPSDPSDPTDPSDPPPAPEITLLATVEQSPGALRPNFDLVFSLTMSDGFEAADIWVHIEAPSSDGTTEFVPYPAGEFITVRPSVIPTVETVTIHAYARMDDLDSDTVVHTYELNYDTISVSIHHGTDGAIGSSTDPLGSVAEAFGRVQDAGGGINEVRLTAGTWTGMGTSVLNGVTGVTVRGTYSLDFTQTGADATIIDASGSGSRVMGISGSSNVRLFDLSLTGGDGVQDGAGLLIENSNSILVGDGVVIHGNSASVRGGGAAVLLSDNVEFSEWAVIHSNTAADGGGMFILGGSANIVRAEVRDNNSTWYGGGISLEDGVGHLIAGTIHGNSSDDGGGILVFKGDGHRIEGLIQSNHGVSFGGGVSVWEGTNHTISATVEYNVSIDGGGMLFDSGSGHAVQGIIRGNEATQDGGGLAIWGVTDFHFLGPLDIENNVAAGFGGGIDIYLVKFATISADVRVSGNQADSGGGVHNYTGPGNQGDLLDITGWTFASNHPEDIVQVQ